ncbi:MAG TPA: 3-isopropylmalate dehydrogenase [Oculatellaceae cyanobacterium]
MKAKIAVLPGDGIGEEVMAQALRVMAQVSEQFDIKFDTTSGLVGGAAYEKYGSHLPDETIALCKGSDAILFGSVGGPVSEMNLPKWKNCEANSILSLRKNFKFNVNLRPVKVLPELAELCPLRDEIINKGVDILFVRELLGDCYFGEHKTFKQADGKRAATDQSIYTEDQIASVAHAAFKAARKRRNKVTSVDKANVLDTSKLWREIVHEVGKEYPDVTLEDMLVDNCAMQIIRDPSQFDVVVTTNMFGDILSDAAAVLPGSLGLMASASLNADGFGLFEPPGGSAQDIAGTGKANPIAQILSLALLLRFALSREDAAQAVENAVAASLNAGYRTADIVSSRGKCVGTESGAADGGKSVKLVDTVGMTDSIIKNLASIKTVLRV